MKGRITVFLLLVSAFLLFQLNAAESKYHPSKLLYKGWIQGHVSHSNKALEVPVLEVNKDQDACGKEPRKVSAVDIGPDGSLRNVVVYLKDITTGKAFPLSATPPVLEQNRCDFSPHVQVVPPMSSIRITNHDNILHSVHAFQFPLESKFVIYPNSITYPAHTIFNIAMVATRKESYQQLGGPGIVKFICEAGHYWMTAYVVVLPHPYFAIAGTDGNFKIEDVPPGKYTLIFWHEVFGAKEQTIQVKENQPVRADFTFSDEL